MRIITLSHNTMHNIQNTNNKLNSDITANNLHADSSALSNEMNYIASLNKISFKSTSKKPKPEFELNLSLKELLNRTSHDSFTEFKMLESESPEYSKLEDGDKKALAHLVKAAKILDTVFLKQDNVHNIAFKEYLENEVEKGNEGARLTLKLFNAQKGIIARDVDANEVKLAKNIETLPGKGFYPEDLSKEEFHNILIKMLKEKKISVVNSILNQRTIVVRHGKNNLESIDYTEYFKDEFTRATEEIRKASETVTDPKFRDFLILQSEALRRDAPLLDAYADKRWAELQNTPLEFTIGRESYSDKMTPTVTENSELKMLLEKYDITPYAKDTLGVRVGIVNKKGTEYLQSIKEHLPLMAENMPFKDEYEQELIKSDDKQAMVDADIVYMSGQNGAYRGKISIASNLPNNDKPALQIGSGKKNVYHIQLRNAKYSNGIEETLNAILDKSQHKYFDTNALHDFTILHENVHSLGPQKGIERLGIYKNTIEENKADMGAIAMLEPLVAAGFYTPLQAKKIITSFITAYVLKGADLNDAHKTRNIMQHNFFIQHGGINISEDGKMTINFDKVLELSKAMLSDAVRLQLHGSVDEAKEFIDKNAAWTKELDLMANNLKKVDKRTNSVLVSPLGDKLLGEET